MDLTKELEISKQLAVQAGKKIMEIYETDFQVDYKDDKSPLTIADQAANNIIVSKLKEEFPQYGILSEEDKEDDTRFNKDFVWIIDPLDGTKEFIKKNGEFTVNIALTYKKRPILGVIYAPVLDKLYFASKGNNAYLTDKNETKQIKVTSKTNDLIMIGSKSHAKPQEKEIAEKHSDRIVEQRAAGSSLKGCLIAEGSADIYYRFGLTCEWDVCAMEAIVIEAGGIFKEMDHSTMIYNREDNLNEKGFYVVNNKENIFV